jgi:hypothetical protein
MGDRGCDALRDESPVERNCCEESVRYGNWKSKVGPYLLLDAPDPFLGSDWAAFMGSWCFCRS